MLTLWGCLEMRTIQIWCCNSSFYGQKSNVSAWMSITKHTGTHPRHSMHSPDTHHVFAVTTVGQKAERQSWLSSPKPTTINEMNKTWNLKRKNSWLMYIPFIFPSFFSSYNSNSVQFSSVAQSCQTPCNPMDCSTPGIPVHHQPLAFIQTHVHWVSDAIQPSHPLSAPSPLTFNLSQHQGLFKWVSSSHQVAKVLEFQLQHQSFQWIFRTDFL